MNGITAELLVLDLYGNIMRRMSERLDIHHEGMKVAANYAHKQGIIDEDYRRRLHRLDAAYHVVRHIDYTTCKKDMTKLDEFRNAHDARNGRRVDRTAPAYPPPDSTEGDNKRANDTTTRATMTRTTGSLPKPGDDDDGSSSSESARMLPMTKKQKQCEDDEEHDDRPKGSAKHKATAEEDQEDQELREEINDLRRMMLSISRAINVERDEQMKRRNDMANSLTNMIRDGLMKGGREAEREITKAKNELAVRMDVCETLITKLAQHYLRKQSGG